MTRTPVSNLIPKALLVVLAILGMGAATVAAVLPAAAAAFATLAPSPLYSNASGLPDSRAYEQVSPANKHGQNAGVVNEFGEAAYSVAADDGEALFYVGSGAMGDSPSGNSNYFVARRSPAGWNTVAAIPREFGIQGLFDSPITVLPSSELASAVFVSFGPFVAPPIGEDNIYLTGASFSVPPEWIGRPTIASPSPGLGSYANQANHLEVDGASSELGRVWFSYGGTLTPEDASRTEGEGLFEWSRAGGLVSAAILPDGSVAPFGAAAAAEPDAGLKVTPATSGNQVSEDGTRAFFVSPDPEGTPSSCTPEVPGGCTPQLYVRKIAVDGTQSTALASRDELAPTVNGLPATSSDGVLALPDLREDGARVNQPYAYSSPDGSRTFFESTDRLTSAAPENELAKEYEFDVSSETLTYLPGVADLPKEPGGNFKKGLGVSPILVSTQDGSRFLFVRYVAGAPAELDMWSNGPGGGQITPVTTLPRFGEAKILVPSAAVSDDGTAFVFSTNSPIPGGFNNGSGVREVYRYDASTSAISCISCAPLGSPLGGDASLSNSDVGLSTANGFVRAGHDLSADGDRVIFETSAALVPRDTNGTEDVYEWENGTVYLISDGTSPEGSKLLDSSENGNDVFFTTTAALLPSDTDGSFDVYDARVPRPGDHPPTTAVPCAGEVCQGPPNEPSLLGPSPTEGTSAGTGNVLPVALSNPPVKSAPLKKTVKCTMGKKLSHGKCVKRKKQAKKVKRASNHRGAK